MHPLSGFTAPTRLIWGNEASRQLAAEVSCFAKRVFISVSPSVKRSDQFQMILQDLTLMGLAHKIMEIKGEPTLGQVELALYQARNFGAECVVGIGGGSPIDLGKATAGLFREESSVLDYFNGRPARGTGIPFIAVPTVAGSGAEVTPNAVLSNPTSVVKLSIRHPEFSPKVAILDPDLMIGVSPQSTAYSGMDGLCQAIEAFTSKGANDFTDLFAKEAAVRFLSQLPTAVADGGNRSVRESLALASVMGGIALSMARLGAVHGLAHPIGVRYNQPHGKVCAVLLPMVILFNMPVSMGKYAELARMFGLTTAGLKPEHQAQPLVDFILNLNTKFGIPCRLREIGVKPEDISSIVAESMPSGSLKANPREASAEDLEKMLRENW